MREIKFEAWDTIEKKMIPNTGYPHTGYDGETAPSKGRYIYREYTGLHDKNGREIYEGDIVVQELPRWHNVYEVKHGGPYLDRAEGGCVRIRSYSWYLDDLKGNTINLVNDEAGNPDLTAIIGNIHENPELLDKSKK